MFNKTILAAVFALVVFLAVSGQSYSQSGMKDEGQTQVNKEHTYDSEGYDEDGYDKSGYNRSGFDRQGLDRNGRDKNGNYRSAIINSDDGTNSSTAPSGEVNSGYNPGESQTPPSDKEPETKVNTNTPTEK